MCIIIDTNSLSAVFSINDKLHRNFEPVFNWILYKRGKIVIAGTTYKNELKRMSQHLKLISQLKKAGKIVDCWDDTSVDVIEKQVKALETRKKFNDAHIVAMVIVTKRRLVCTGDIESYQFLKNHKLYLGQVRKPSIYRGLSNKNLLSKCYNIDNICNKCTTLNKKQKEALVFK